MHYPDIELKLKNLNRLIIYVKKIVAHKFPVEPRKTLCILQEFNT